jgi:hypothetical protein
MNFSNWRSVQLVECIEACFGFGFAVALTELILTTARLNQQVEGRVVDKPSAVPSMDVSAGGLFFVH